MKRSTRIAYKLIRFTHKLPSRQLMIAISIVVGFIVGIIAVVIKNLVHFIQSLLTGGFSIDYSNYLYVLYPAIGVLVTILFVKYLLRKPVRDGVPNVLHAISRNYGLIKPHNMYSSIVSSALTVGFGGSVGLEGPTVVTGAAWGSNIGRLLGLNYKQEVALLGMASAAAMSAIFKAPIAAIVFALEVILFDLTMTAMVPLLVASIVAALTSYFFIGMDVLYPFEVIDKFRLRETPFYLGLGLFTSLLSYYFIRLYVITGKIFDKIRGWFWRFLTGASLLGLIIFLMPSLYGEGYEAINEAMHSDFSFIFDNSIFYDLSDNLPVTLLLMLGIVLFKALATSLTFRAGGIGGIFAPTLFMGTMAGLFFVSLLNYFGDFGLPASSFVLVGMAGMLAGVVHAPLTAIFLIAEITGGYQLFFPIMIVATTSYSMTRLFSPRSIYTIQLANRGDMLTHHKDKTMLSMMNLKDEIETDFSTVDVNANLGDLVKVVANSTRNIFPVVDKEENLYGLIFLDHIRHTMFKPELYEETTVRSLMFKPSKVVSINDDMETVAQKFQHSGKYNLVVVDGDKYLGFVSRANVYSHYRDILRDFSED
jgi:CIC family chloride channel protein